MNPAEQFAAQEANPNFSYREATEDDIEGVDPTTLKQMDDGSFMTPEGVYFKAGKDYTKEEPSVQVESGAKPDGIHETYAPSTATRSDELEAPVPAGQGAEPSKIDADPNQPAEGENTYSEDPLTKNKGEDPTVLGETTAQLNPQEQYMLQKKQTELRLVQEQLKPLDEATDWDKFQTGADATLQGMEQTIYDTMTGAGNALEMMTGVNIDASKLSKDNLLQIEILKAKLDSFSDSGDILTWQNLGGATPALLTLPIGIQSKLGMGLIEGVLAYAENRGLAKSVTESLMWGVGVGAGSMVVAHGIQVITERYGFGTLEKMLKTELDYTDSEAKQIYEEFAEATGKDVLNNDEKALALVSAGHERGAAFQQVVALDTKASTVMTRIADSKNAAIRGATVDKEVLTPYRELKAQSDTLSVTI